MLECTENKLYLQSIAHMDVKDLVSLAVNSRNESREELIKTLNSMFAKNEADLVFIAHNLSKLDDFNEHGFKDMVAEFLLDKISDRINAELVFQGYAEQLRNLNGPSTKRAINAYDAFIEKEIAAIEKNPELILTTEKPVEMLSKLSANCRQAIAWMTNEAFEGPYYGTLEEDMAHEVFSKLKDALMRDSNPNVRAEIGRKPPVDIVISNDHAFIPKEPKTPKKDKGMDI